MSIVCMYVCMYAWGGGGVSLHQLALGSDIKVTEACISFYLSWQ